MSNLDPKTWKAKMSGIYSDFEVGMKLATQDGMKPDPVITDRKGGYFIGFSLHQSVTEQVAEFASRAKALVPSLVVYQESNLHTTISDLGVTANFVPGASKDHDLILQKLSRAVTATQSLRYGVGCSYKNGFIFNQTTGILRGVPSESFLAYAELAIAKAKEEGIELRLPWGSHVSFARTSEVVTAEDAVKLAKLCKIFPISKNFWGQFVSLNAGFSWVSKGKFNVEYAISRPL